MFSQWALYFSHLKFKFKYTHSICSFISLAFCVILLCTIINVWYHSKWVWNKNLFFFIAFAVISHLFWGRDWKSNWQSPQHSVLILPSVMKISSLLLHSLGEMSLHDCQERRDLLLLTSKLDCIHDFNLHSLHTFQTQASLSLYQCISMAISICLNKYLYQSINRLIHR